jgi:hypothetical protein
MKAKRKPTAAQKRITSLRDEFVSRWYGAYLLPEHKEKLWKSFLARKQKLK